MLISVQKKRTKKRSLVTELPSSTQSYPIPEERNPICPYLSRHLVLPGNGKTLIVG